MNSIFCCGFEEGVFGPHWNIGVGSPAFTTSNPISGARSLRCNPTSSTHSVLSVDSFGAGIWVLRCKVLFTTLPDQATTLLGLPNSLTGAYYSAGFIGASANGSSPGQDYPVVTGIVYCLDVKIDTTANPWVVDVQINGVPAPQATSATAASTAASQIRVGFRTGVSLTADAIFDDVVISTTAADYPIGPGYINHFVPTSDGAHNIAGTADFQRGNSGTDILNATTTAFQLIDDVPLPSGTVDEADNIRAVAPPNATDYTECVFGPAPGISAPTVAPRGVEVVLAHHQIATQTGQTVVELNDNGTIDTIFDTGSAAGVITYRYARKHYASGPAGAWVIGGGGNGDFTDLRVRFRSPDAAPDQCLDAVMIEAEFAGPLFTKQTLANGSDLTVGQDLSATLPSNYALSIDITETASSVVIATVSSQSAEGETMQQQAVLQSSGGGNLGSVNVKPGQRVAARLQVSGADTNVGVAGAAS